MNWNSIRWISGDKNDSNEGNMTLKWIKRPTSALTEWPCRDLAKMKQKATRNEHESSDNIYIIVVSVCVAATASARFSVRFSFDINFKSIYSRQKKNWKEKRANICAHFAAIANELNVIKCQTHIACKWLKHNRWRRPLIRFRLWATYWLWANECIFVSRLLLLLSSVSFIIL